MPPHTTIVLPAFNEEEALPVVVDDIRSVLGSDADILVVDDGSSDGTADAARQLGCSVRSLQRYERKARTPDVKTLLRMGVLYDLDHREFRQLARFWQ